MISSFHPTKQRKTHKKVYGFDIETYNHNKRFLCASIYSEDYNKTFYNKRSLINELKTKRYHNSIIAAHNLAFDFFGLFYNEPEETEFNPLFRNSDLLLTKTYIYGEDFHRNLKFIDKKRVMAYSLTFIDCMNYGKISVHDSGDMIKLPKLKTPVFIGKKPKNKQEWSEMVKYNMRDAEVSQKYFTFLSDNFINLGCSFKKTIAASAMSLFQNKYLKQTFYRHSEEQLLFQFAGYYGGRCECFARGSIENEKLYDYNSLYPSVMLNHDYPDPNTIRNNYKNTVLYIDNYEGFSEVEIHCPLDMDIPLLPYRTDDKLIFPVGTFRGVYANVELREAVLNGYIIKKVYRNLYFTEKLQPFNDYVNDLYVLRKQHKAAKSSLEILDKMLMNSLYGKFGQKFINKDNIIPIPQTTAEINKYDYFEPLSRYYARVKFAVTEPRPWCIPAWAAYVTAYGRIKLWHLLRVCNPKYCDTDSVITSKNYNSSSELGELKLEKMVKTGIIVRPKFYMLHDGHKNKAKIKGVGMKIVCKDFMSILQGNKVKYKKFVKFRESLRRGLLPNEIISITKKLNLDDDKRVWKSNFTLPGLEYSKPMIIEPITNKHEKTSKILYISQPIIQK